MSSLKLAAILTFALTANAFAAEPPAPAPGQAAQNTAPAKAAKPAADPKEKLICTRETVVGSTIPKRVCRSAAQIDQDHSKFQRAMEEIRGADRDAPAAAGAR